METKDAKYFGARIGERCWYENKDSVIIGAESFNSGEFSVTIKFGSNFKISTDGEGITFEAPRKKSQITIDGFVLWYPKEADRLGCFAREYVECDFNLKQQNKTTGTITDGAQIVPGKLIFEIEE